MPRIAKRCYNGIATVLSLCLWAVGGAAFAQTDLLEGATKRIDAAVKKTGVLPKPYDFYARVPYRAEVPRPDATLGYPLGTWHTTFRDQEKTLQAIAAACPDRVKAWEYGKSVEGRPLRVYAVSSLANIARLEEIRKENLTIAAGTQQPNPLTTQHPAIIWLNHTIHGSETASFETAMATLYTLAASDAPEIARVRDSAVVLINPVFNPDGHERFVVSYNAAAVGDAEDGAFESETPWLAQGRFNHNRFDMNRDKLAQSQPETRQETAEYLRWMPHVFCDLHGQPETYFFPPNAQATNPHVDRARMERWTQTFGRANGAAFDARGWSYVNRETYDLFYPGYLDSFSSLNGAVGMTFETDGGGELATKKRDGTITTLRDAAAHHFEAALATVQSAAANREKLVADFAAFRASATKQSGTVIVSPARDPNRLHELADLLTRLGVESSVLSVPLTLKDAVGHETPGAKPRPVTLPAGSLVVRVGQAQGHLARAVLEADTGLEPEFVAVERKKNAENKDRNPNEPTEDYDFYDTTAWSLPLIYGLEAFTTETPVAATATGAPLVPPLGGIIGNGTNAAAFVLPLTTDNTLVLAARFEQDGFRVSVATKPVTVGGKPFAPGTLFVLPGRNPDGANTRLAELARTLGVSVTAIPSTFGGAGARDGGLGSDAIVPVSAPKIAVLAGDGVSQTGYGGAAFLLKQCGIAFRTVSIRAWKSTDTRAVFNVLIIPEGSYRSRFDKDDVAALKSWAERGNTVIALGSGATWLTNKDADMTTVRPVGASEDEKKGDDKTPDESPAPLPGAIFAATVRTDNFLGWGYPHGTIPVPLSGDTFWKPSTTGTNAVTFGKSAAKLSGFVWDDTQKTVRGSAYVVDEPTSRGHIVLFLNDPTERYLYLGLRRMFLSAVLFGR